MNVKKTGRLLHFQTNDQIFKNTPKKPQLPIFPSNIGKKQAQSHVSGFGSSVDTQLKYVASSMVYCTSLPLCNIH